MNFVADFNTWGPYLDGRTYQTGLVFAGKPAFKDAISQYTGYGITIPVGRYATADCTNGVIRRTSAWKYYK